MNWLTDFVRPKIKKVTPKEIADNLWVKCPICGQMLFSKEMKKSLNQETLGVPVYAVGIPTVVDAATLAADLLEESGLTEVKPERLRQGQQTLMVTPRDIDQQVRDLSKVVGYGINWALQDLEIEEINALLS